MEAERIDPETASFRPVTKTKVALLQFLDAAPPPE